MDGLKVPPPTPTTTTSCCVAAVVRSCESSRLQRQLLARAYQQVCPEIRRQLSDDEKAIATAAWIRSRQTDPALQAFAGLTTLASVEARRASPGTSPDDAAYRQTFFNAFTRWLATLPHTPEIASMLRNQRAKINGITEAVLLAEARDVIAPALARRGYCSLAEADQLVRVRHRMVSIVPVRTETLRALDAAVVARSSR